MTLVAQVSEPRRSCCSRTRVMLIAKDRTEPTMRIGGNEVFRDEEVGCWRYLDGERVIRPQQRPCPECGLAFKHCLVCIREMAVADAHDPCLGHIDEVSSACCGHGLGGDEAHVLTYDEDAAGDYGAHAR